MPKGTAFDLESLKAFKAKTVKAEGEETLEVFKPATGKLFRLCGFTVFHSKAAVLTLLDETTVILYVAVAENVGQNIVLPEQGFLSAKAGNKLNLKTTVEGSLTASFYGIEDVA